MTLQEMYDEMAQLAEEMRLYLEEHENENGELTTEEAETFDRMDKKFTALKEKIDRHERVAKVDNYLSTPITQTILPQPGAMGGGWIIGSPIPKGAKNMSRKISAGISGESYRREFIGAIRDNFRHAVTNSYLREGALPQGGYLVPEELDSQIVSALEGANVMRQLCRVILTASDHRIPIVASKPAATWTAEGEALTFSNETFNQVTLEAYKLSVGLKISNDLLQDSFFDLENHIIKECVAAIANTEEQAFLLGTGNGQPQGLLTAIDANTDAVITTSGTEITADDLIQLEYSLNRPYRKSACFVTSDNAMAQIRRLKDSTGNFLWTPSLAEGEPGRLLGYPCHTSQFMPPARSGAMAICFGDMSAAYTIADRGARQIQPLRELFAVEDISAFIVRERVDGRLVDDKAVKALRVK